MVVPPRGVGGTVVAHSRAFSPLARARFFSLQSSRTSQLCSGVLEVGCLVCGKLVERVSMQLSLRQESAAECRCLHYTAFGLMPSYQSSSALANIHGREEL